MRLLSIIGSLQGQIGAATKIAMDRGAKVVHAGDIEQGLKPRCVTGMARTSCSATSPLDIGELVRALSSERICTPVVACGIGTDARRRSRCDPRGQRRNDLPLSLDAELIAAVHVCGRG